MTQKIIVTTGLEISGKTIKKVLGIVKGNTVRSRHIGADIAAAFKTLIGGEIKGYTIMITEARDEAYHRMIQEAQKIGADAVIGMRFDAASVMQNSSEILCYGTAVKFS